MANRSASTYKSKSSGYSYAYRWANLSLEYINDGILYGDNTTEQGSRTITEFVNNGITLSVYNVDTEQQMTYYINNASKLKCICTNYTRKLLTKMGKL
jgi:glycerophosphoryl diester phosphodiesterase